MECPWCHKEVNISKRRCPHCRQPVYEVTDQDFEPGVVDEHEDVAFDSVEVQDQLRSRYVCAKCKHDDCMIKEVAMTGTGLSKLFDIQHNHYWMVSCTNCGVVDVYDPSVLLGKQPGKLGTVMDILFGR